MQAAYSEAAERNKWPILEKLHTLLASSKSVLEVGSGTGQHAVYFASALPYLIWQPSELPDKLPMLSNRCLHHPAENLVRPIALDIDNDHNWIAIQADAVFTANTLHIIHWPQVCKLFIRVGRLLPANGLFCTYGPFNTDGRYTSESNAQFDNWLKNRDVNSGIRDIYDLQYSAEQNSLRLQENFEMPANNRLLAWRKLANEAVKPTL
ncbi:DUF938 domain-containing protein [Nitrosomonas marina]|uniref:DUF938 domain-containing protein n=1 Tax=Nitrosomonas marina TaxID=917 RepID=A0A1H8E2H4_9PROT|nr:DUF938 domain-containing protein [Nitrosomonas marina]SEN12997.1 Protein of unknown function [Nitrosomonas marina]